MYYPMITECVVGDGLCVVSQDLAQDLPQEQVALNHVLEDARKLDPLLKDQQARAVLGALGLTGGKPLQTIGSLSGGEKARVALAKFALRPANLLFLDESSNHLDVPTIHMLADCMKAFPGAVVLVSHDRPFVERLQPTHVAHCKGGKLQLFARELVEADWDMGVGEDAARLEAATAALAAPPVLAGDGMAMRGGKKNSGGEGAGAKGGPPTKGGPAGGASSLAAKKVPAGLAAQAPTPGMGAPTPMKSGKKKGKK